MPVIDVIWNLPDDPDGNVQHIAQHGLIPSDVEYDLNYPRTSRSSNRPMVFGRTHGGEEIVVVYDEIDAGTVYPITAYPVEE
jgi:hypothetical protein